VTRRFGNSAPQAEPESRPRSVTDTGSRLVRASTHRDPRRPRPVVVLNRALPLDRSVRGGRWPAFLRPRLGGGSPRSAAALTRNRA